MRPQPNILLIVSDDHGYGDRSALGHDPAVSTPGLDRLAAEGVTCTDAYVAAPICSPSRAAIMSGRYPQRWGATWFENSRFAPDGETLAERLAAVGYRTGYFGKVHYGPEGPGDRACPPHHGFDTTYYGLAGRQQGRLNYLRHSDAAVAEYGEEASWRMAVQPMLEGDTEVELEGFLTAEIGRRAREFVTVDADAPFFAMVAFNAVHNFCWQLPADELAARGLPTRADWNDADEQPYADWYDGAITPNLEHGREYYLAQLELMDREIDALLDELDRGGRREDTIVVYLTDNGGSPCNYGDNTPLAGSKYTLWEGGVRVPFLVRWPGGGWDGGRSSDALVSSLDLYPTLLAAAGDGDAAGSDGVDLGGVLAGGSTAAHGSLHWDCGYQWAVRSGDLKLAWVDGASEQAQGIRAVEHAEPGDGWRLHDLRADVGEQHDLASERPDDVARLTALHEAWRAEIGYHVAEALTRHA
jgi:arylsulfatase A-like enzyme